MLLRRVATYIFICNSFGIYNSVITDYIILVAVVVVVFFAQFVTVLFYFLFS